MNRIDRLTGIILLLQSHRLITAEQIAAHYEISVRTVYRDLAALGEAGVPIIAEAGVGYSLMRGYHMPPVMFTEDEAAALFLSGEVTEQIADESLRDSLRAALLKVRSVLPPERRDYLDRLSKNVSVWIKSPTRDEEGHQALMRLQEAVVRRRCTALRYDAGNRGEITTRLVEPLGVVFYSRQWHLIAFCRMRRAMRDFRLDRMVDWEVHEEVFSGHDDFSLNDFLEEAIRGKQLNPATLIFHPQVMDRVRNEMMCTQIEETRLPDGRIRIDTLTGSLEWLAGWVLSFGTQVEVAHPLELRSMVRNAAFAIAEVHAGAFENSSPLLT